jgi:hypothetical protein
MDDETRFFLLVLAAILGFIAAMVGHGILIWKSYSETKAKRRDDKRATKLTRLNKQVSDLYGPLYALYETGERNWFAFIEIYSQDPMPVPLFRRFFPSEGREVPAPDREALKAFRRYMKTMFMPTNVAMEECIVNNAELLVGKTIPDPLIQLCVHVASNKPVLDRWKTKEFDDLDHKDHQPTVQHPGFAVRNHIRAAFHVLKEEQEKVINDPEHDPNEDDLEKKIVKRVKLLDMEVGSQEADAMKQLVAKLLVPELSAAASDEIESAAVNPPPASKSKGDEENW